MNFNKTNNETKEMNFIIMCQQYTLYGCTTVAQDKSDASG